MYNYRVLVQFCSNFNVLIPFTYSFPVPRVSNVRKKPVRVVDALSVPANRIFRKQIFSCLQKVDRMTNYCKILSSVYGCCHLEILLP